MKTNQLVIKNAASPDEAPKYTSPEFKAADIDHVLIVRKGTVGNKSTIDIVFVDEQGQKYITMITAALIQTLVRMVGPE